MNSTRNTKISLKRDLIKLGVKNGMTLMVHSSLSKIGWTDGGADTVIGALLDAVGTDGTLVMPTGSSQLSEQETSQQSVTVFNPKTTPTTMGAIPETFRLYPNIRRSNHPLVSVSAIGPNAREITRDHALSFSEGRGTPFEKLYQIDSMTLLLGVGFNRCTSLHYSESLCNAKRVTKSRFPMMQNSKLVWLEVPEMGADNGTLFPIIGAEFVKEGVMETSRVGDAECLLFSTRSLVDFALPMFDEMLDC